MKTETEKKKIYNVEKKEKQKRENKKRKQKKERKKKRKKKKENRKRGKRTEEGKRKQYVPLLGSSSDTAMHAGHDQPVPGVSLCSVLFYFFIG